MYCTKKVTEHITWIGGNDRRLALFESVYPIPMGVSYNSYFVSDEKTMVLDTVDKSVSGQFFENIESVRNGRKMDYLVVNHMEPDHAAVIDEFVLRYPEVQIICNEKIAEMMKQFFTFDVDSRTIIVKEGDTISTGQHTFTFVMAPMVHWPEVMMTYEVTNKILFSADAFGTFGALNGQLFADEVDFDRDYLDEARRYYTNIVGKYATQVQAALQKAASIEINMICPLHGFVWRKNIGKIRSLGNLYSRSRWSFNCVRFCIWKYRKCCEHSCIEDRRCWKKSGCIRCICDTFFLFDCGSI